MRHHKKLKKFGRERNQRKALIKSLVFNLVKNEKIKTTETKAKTLRTFVEKYITKAKSGELDQRKLLIARVGDASAKKITETIAPRYKDRNGGYTRVVKLPRRKSDGSKMAIVEFV